MCLGYHTLVPGINSIFRDGIGPFNLKHTMIYFFKHLVQLFITVRTDLKTFLEEKREQR